MQKAGLPSPTVFEIETALAFLYFKEKRCDIVTLEVGCGGLLDATNVITTTLMEVIASISMDHTDLLGDTLAKIAAQKAGIIKPDTMVVSAQQKSEAAQVIEDTCKEQHCTLQMVDESKISNVHYGAEGQTFSYKTWENVAISLAGSYQIQKRRPCARGRGGTAKAWLRALRPAGARGAAAHCLGAAASPRCAAIPRSSSMGRTIPPRPWN